LYNSLASLPALYACKAPTVPFSAAQTMPLLVPLAETAGVAPGYTKVSGLLDAAVVARNAPETGNAFRLSFSPP
jgi:hypothetical protein